MDSSTRSYLFTSATVRIPVHTAPTKCGTEPMPYMTPHFREQRRAASLGRYRNRAEITVSISEQKRYPE